MGDGGWVGFGVDILMVGGGLLVIDWLLGLLFGAVAGRGEVLCMSGFLADNRFDC
jgi:hypothetical protein